MDFSLLISRSARKVHEGILMVRERKLTSENFASCIKSLHEFENQGDKLHRKVLEDMIGKCSPDYGGENILSIIKWKEVFQTLEHTLDICEDFAAFFGILRIKYG
jgi:hypothetical protein